MTVNSVSRICLFATIALGLAVGGCGGGPTLGRVEGTVSLDGKPLPNAKVEFQPTSGSPSYGETDAAGFYSLMFSPGNEGAIPGQHIVRISTYQADPKPGSTEFTPESVPEIYNSQSTLKETVETGSQTIDFNLTTPSED